PRRVHPAEDTDEDPKAYSLDHGHHTRHGEKVLGGAEHQGAYHVPGKETEKPSNQASNYTDDSSLVDEHAHHLFFLGADAAHDSDLLDPLVHRHHHDIEDGDPGNDHRDAADGRD